MDNKKPVYVVDIESNGLLKDVTKIHVLSYSHVDSLEVKTLRNREDIKKFLSQDGLQIIGHNFVMYDSQAIKKVFGIEPTYRVIDTLAVSWYLEASTGRKLHGLEVYGEELGVKKIEVGADVWDGDMSDPSFNFLMTERCESDVRINWLLWKKQQSQLISIYNKDALTIHRLLDYLTFKMDCFREQMENGIQLDAYLCIKTITELEDLSNEKTEALRGVMPKIPIITIRRKPKVMHKADGTLSALGEKWEALLKEEYLPDSTEEVEVLKGFEEANPASGDQLKKWLYSLGWEPRHIKYQRNKKTGDVKQIPQISSEFDKGEVCDSIKELIPKEPALEYLSGLSTINHRLGVLKGFVRDVQKGCKIHQDLAGFTNTMRVRHRILVNLPKPGNPYADSIRECLIAPEGYKMCGSDLSGIEDATKQHYIFPYDPEYVKDLQSSDYDAHTNMGVNAGLITEDEELFFKWYSWKQKKKTTDTEPYKGTVSEGLKKLQDISEGDQKVLMSKLEDIRQKSKVVNFSATYSVGAKTLARNMKVSVKEAQKILDAYWKRNKSIKEFVASVERKVVDGQMWVRQPVSGFWYSLRYEKDIFSTVNQSTAVYVFDEWVKHIRDQGVKLSYQSHDENLILLKEGEEDCIKTIIDKSIEMTNEELKLEVVIGCSMDFGINYKECH